MRGGSGRVVVGAAGDAVIDLVLVMGSFMLNNTGHHTARDNERQDCQENANAKDFSHICRRAYHKQTAFGKI